MVTPGNRMLTNLLYAPSSPRDNSDPAKPGNERQDHERTRLASESANDDNEDS
jgi:hypothetical protein